MRKLLLFVTFAFLLGSCAKENVALKTSSLGPNSETRSINDIFTLTKISIPNIPQETIYSDASGNLYCGYKSSLSKYDATTGTWPILGTINLTIPFPGGVSAIAVDNNGNWVAQAGNLGMEKKTADLSSSVDFTSFFPFGSIFLGVCTAQNGNMFVSIASGDIVEVDDGFGNMMFKSCTKQTVYRLNSNGVLALMAEIDEGINVFNYQAHNLLMKANGANIYGYTDSGYFKLNTNTKEVDYYAPSIPVTAYAAAINKANLYGVSGNKIVELKPNGSYTVVAMIPSSIGNLNYSTCFAVNGDATVFYIAAYDVYKLTL